LEWSKTGKGAGGAPEIRLTANASRTENMLVSGGGDKAVNIWSLDSGKLIGHLVGHKEDVEAVTFTANNRFVVSSSEDKSVRIWSVDNRELLVRMFFEKGSGRAEGATFDNQLFGDNEADLIKVKVEDKVLSPVEKLTFQNYLGRGVSIQEF
jgi:WD40 repeat protein